MSESATRVEEFNQADLALENLLQTLLTDVPEYQEPEVAVAASPAEVVSVPESAVELNVSEPLPIQEASTAETVPPTLRPEWATGELKVLVVRLGELRVAVPLVKLSSISPTCADSDVARLPAQPDWHRGVVPVRDRQLVRVDPVALLRLAAERQQPAYLLVIDDGRYGLEIDAMEEPLTVDGDLIRWRQQGEGRDWILGMLPEQMCVLLDVDVIAQRLGTNV